MSPCADDARAADGPDSAYAWRRLWASLALSTIGGVGLWTLVVVLPSVQADLGLVRADATIPYTATMLGWAAGGVLMGRLADRFGVVLPILLGTIALAAGFVLSAMAHSLAPFALAQAVLVGLLGSSSTFTPLVADVSHWFRRRRGAAIGIVASGNYLAGTLWPPVIQLLVGLWGWRSTFVAIGLFCLATMLPLALLLRRPTPREDSGATSALAARDRAADAPAPISPNALQAVLVVAGITCCLAMSMPQVHIVAYCADLGYGPARGSEMLSVMLGFGVVSRLVSGWICDRIGGVRTMLLGSALQMLSLMLYLPFDGLISLYVVSALFGLAQGGIVPSYAIIVRERLPAAEAGQRIGVVLMATIVGMAAGGWLSGAIFDWTGSYQAAFLNGIGWNAVNVAIGLWLLLGGRTPARRPRPA